jgi:quercetin dioxygenase-like cupin family protein
MGVVHKREGAPGTFNWPTARFRRYGEGASEGASVSWLIGKDEEARNFALRYFEIEPGGWSRLERHEHDHGVIVLRGTATVQVGEEKHRVSYGDVVYIPPDEAHQFVNDGDEPFGFLCVIPAMRRKGDKMVYAEEDSGPSTSS